MTVVHGFRLRVRRGTILMSMRSLQAIAGIGFVLCASFAWAQVNGKSVITIIAANSGPPPACSGTDGAFMFNNNCLSAYAVVMRP